DTVCRAFAKSTGGVYEQNPRKVGELIARIGQDMLARYHVYFRPEEPEERVPEGVPLPLSLVPREGIRLTYPKEFVRRYPLKEARPVLGRHPSKRSSSEFLSAVLRVGREGTVDDARDVYAAYKMALQYEARRRDASLGEVNRATTLSALERLAGVQSDDEYRRARGLVFNSLVRPVRDALLYGSTQDRESALHLLDDIRGFVGERAWGNYAGMYFNPLLELACRPTLVYWTDDQRRSAKRLLEEAGRSCPSEEQYWRALPNTAAGG
ncbi:hypothetical protein D6783_05665, partial [Candidatus Woesearchaeota archaeon]